MNIPRICISALKGGGGKTLLSLGLCSALTSTGMRIKAFKKGPDYIDAHWLAKATGHDCTNLDPHFLENPRLQSLFAHHIQDNVDMAIIEGNRGLFDGQDVKGTYSTAELAKNLRCPVIISLDITKMTRTAAAIIHGLSTFDPEVHIGGVVLNSFGSTRHENIVRQAIEYYTDIPVFGALPRLKENPLPERHMGLTALDSESAQEAAEQTLQKLGNFVTEHCDLLDILHLARSADPLPKADPFWPENTKALPKNSVRIAYIQDQAFWFYYAENLEALRQAGAELVPLSILDNTPWPEDLHGLYIGGGYPEEYLEILCNSPHLATLRHWSELHMPIYAECGGFMLLAKHIVRENTAYSMAGIFPVQAEFFDKPQGLGYVTAEVTGQNPFHPEKARIHGHEFHYSRCQWAESQGTPTSTLSLSKGLGMGKVTQSRTHMNQDGLLVRQTFAAYTHIFAPSCPWWAPNFVQLAQTFKDT